MVQGICHIVGAGPGDPGLITVRGLGYLRQAEAVYYDHLVAPELLSEAPPAAQRLYVGKHGCLHAIRQEDLNELLCDSVRAGRITVRLKGGDPFVFGRGGEEALALSQAGLPFTITPGVTSGIAAPAYAGIPVTNRGLTPAVTLVTGHEATDKNQPPVDWRALARMPHTICVYMGIKNLGKISEELMAGGRPATEPAAVIQWGTRPDQRCVSGTLDTIARQVEQEQLAPPAILVVGPVVSLREACAWFDPAGAAQLGVS